MTTPQVFSAKRMRLQIRKAFEDITQEIIQALESQILDVNGVLKYAAKGLRKLGYRRIFFSLVDPKGEHIAGAWDDAAEPFFNIASNSWWLLDDANVDVQPYVVRTKNPIIVADAHKHPLVNKKVVQPAGLLAFALIPLIALPKG